MVGKVNCSELDCVDGNKIGVVELDNPASLNALTLDMLRQLKAKLEVWESDERIVCVFLHGVGEKAFCAGGDVRTMYNMMRAASEREDQAEMTKQFLTEYFTVEYGCDYLIHRYSKPVIVWGEGIIMGGGMGLYMGASHRVTTPTSRLAMPEISIGLYPDVGGTWFLNKLPDGIGMFLGLTGAQINATDALELGMSEHMLIPEQKQSVLEKLQGSNWVKGNKDADGDLTFNKELVTEMLTGFADTADPHRPVSYIRPYFSQIQLACKADDLAGISRQIMSIEGDSRWLERAKRTLEEGSPITANICFRQLTQYHHLSLEECFRLELSLSVHCGLLGEFEEGVRARLIDKCGQPGWLYTTLSEVDQSVIDSLFTPLWDESENPLATLGQSLTMN
ncbi:enoyl-CoA hydratase/isomerase family protein [Photobacterium sp. OFAV2-7]|uniref:enoyl-CoA hydratase/isomerase family protein n=1 Tax=Photobacterium sp. OFAV2-7 TaxID=2917748 RepID=UPI001EF4AB12|nr:enoyl-CoA hydratase/isomerase family protein [Photobacterium sp. OFAV2-7]MCG7588532.1 enoyl-CoA hydratase/isomerase family protein [Photobacterium sp. OFAV2-7]